jgi:hypothetical protein
MLLFSRSIAVSLSFLTDQTDAGLHDRFTQHRPGESQ